MVKNWFTTDAIVSGLLRKYPLISQQVTVLELGTLLVELQFVLSKEVEGDVVEMGCYKGTSALFLQRLLTLQQATKQLHVYDSFAGLPKKTSIDHSVIGEQFKAGELFATKSQLITNFKKANLPLPVIHKNWFSELSPDALPARISFAFLDGDFYDSIKTCLQLIERRVSKGAVIIIDDYHSQQLPGVARAVDEWTASTKLRIQQFQVVNTLAIIRVHGQ